MIREKIVAGNWKMNLSLSEASDLVDNFLTQLNSLPKQINGITKILIPPFPYLNNIGKKINMNQTVFLGAQNCFTKESGAYTGEVSAKILKSVGTQYVLIGHSERRYYFHETNEELVLKIKEALTHHLKPIFCIGETLNERETKIHFEVISLQLKEVVSKFTASEFSNFIIAYEPVWAIGTGLTASTEQAQEMHAFIRNEISKLFSTEIAQHVSILYGGSCNAQNSKELFNCPDVDGGLIGGASLKAEEFCNIINSF
ncbi:MAG: triose-phosphate isomerase [Bacteroidota bacterium]